MGTIIVGVDLSQGSEIAIDIAANLSKRFGHTLQFVGVNETGLPRAELIAEIHRREANNAEKLAGLKFEYILRKGDITDAICDQSRAVNASLVVVGTHDSAGLQKNLFGQFSYALIEKTTAPVLCVREGFQFNSTFKHILAPIDGSDTSRQKVPMAVRFAKAFGSVLHVVGVNSSSMSDSRNLVKSYILQTKTYLDSIGVENTLEQVDANGNVSKTVLDAAQRWNADLVLMMKECGVSLIKHLVTSDDNRLLSESRTPILIIKPEQLHTLKVM